MINDHLQFQATPERLPLVNWGKWILCLDVCFLLLTKIFPMFLLSWEKHSLLRKSRHFLCWIFKSFLTTWCAQELMDFSSFSNIWHVIVLYMVLCWYRPQCYDHMQVRWTVFSHRFPGKCFEQFYASGFNNDSSHQYDSTGCVCVCIFCGISTF